MLYIFQPLSLMSGVFTHLAIDDIDDTVLCFTTMHVRGFTSAIT